MAGVSDMLDKLKEVRDAACSKEDFDTLVEAIDEIERLRAEVKTVYLDGEISGLRRYAWWKDGVQYVGTNDTTLASAIAPFLRRAAEGVKDE